MINDKKFKILLLFAGGTIGMVHNIQTGALEPAQNSNELLNEVPELNQIVELGFEFVVNIDSSNICPDHWTMLANRIAENYDKYDGFVVAHGTDTMAYTASALSFALQGINKPVVFTGSLIPLREIGSDARNNLVYACMTAELDIAEVCILIGNKIMRGNRAKKKHESFIAAFHSPNYPELGELGRPITLNQWRKKRDGNNLSVQPNFDHNITLIKLFPGFDPYILDNAIEHGTHGIIVEGFGPGNVPFLEHTIIPHIKKAVEKNIPVIITNQMEYGKTNLQSYEAGLKALEVSAISGKDMTVEAVVTKLMWVLGFTKDMKQIGYLMSKDLAGELSV